MMCFPKKKKFEGYSPSTIYQSWSSDYKKHLTFSEETKKNYIKATDNSSSTRSA